MANLNPVVGSEQGGIRPVLILSNNIGNHYGPTVICAAITSRKSKNRLPTHVPLKNVTGLPNDSVVLLEQVRTIDKSRIKSLMAVSGEATMKEIESALEISIGCVYGR